ncbi:hypothetical protein ES706_05658 [subsurface metagenome]
MAHGIVLNDLKQKIKTKIGIILDIDCTFLYKTPFFGKIFLKAKGKREKKKWIKICKKIVDIK